MTVCLDTNVFLQIFGKKQPYYSILRAVLDGQITLALYTDILLEYEEVTVQLSGAERWQDIAKLIVLLDQLHDNIRQVEPQYRFGIIVIDPDDNKFCDCAIAAGADFVVTEDNHFSVLKAAGYKPQPITPSEFIRSHLAS